MKHRNSLSPPRFPYSWASEWGEDLYGLWQAFTYQGIRLAFRWIPPGSFKMGSPEGEKGRYLDEKLHAVKLSQGFWLAETTVTQALWQALMDKNPSTFKGDNRPVELVSWDDAQVFIERLNQLHPDLHARLPYEAEWEYACRAGSRTPFNFDGDVTLDKVNYGGAWNYLAESAEGALQKTAEVKSYPCNDWGLYEMHGNVWEWCADVWPQQLSPGSVTDPLGTEAEGYTAHRVVRGGSWGSYGNHVRSANRYAYPPDYRNSVLGFRLALGHSSPGEEDGAKG